MSLASSILNKAKRSLVLPPWEQRAWSELRVAVGVSGGVDSLVSAWLLTQLGCSVTAVHFQNWSQKQHSGLPLQWCAERELADFHFVCDSLALNRRVFDYSALYWSSVFCPMLDAFESGLLTPNPDVCCARHLQFGTIQADLIQQHNFDYYASGHYAQIRWDQPTPSLVECADLSQCQTCWLSQVQPSSHTRHLFPLAALIKATDVRPLADEICPRIARKRSSKGLCFVGARDFLAFLSEFLDCANEPGSIEDHFGNVIPNLKHDGLAFYTIGQRIASSAQHGPFWNTHKMYVCAKDVSRNVLLVGHSRDPRLFTHRVCADLSTLHWLSKSHRTSLLESGTLMGKARCRLPAEQVPCQLTLISESRVCFQFTETPVRAVTAGQYLVFTDHLSGVVVCSLPIPLDFAA